MKLRVLAEKIYQESQCGFMAKSATKAFDLVSRDDLFKILATIGCPPTLLSIVKSFHDDMTHDMTFSRLRAKTRVHEKYVRDLLFADDAAITTHTQEDLQWLLDRFSEACRYFGLTISLAKTQVMGQDIKEIPSFYIHNYKLEVVHEFVYLGSTITDIRPSTVNSISELRRLP